MILRLLTLANAGAYPGKREWFYPFKDRFLRAWGDSDGYDKQIIQKTCFRCKGSGAYVSRCAACRYEGGCYNCHWQEDDESFDEYIARADGRCPKCGGSGWFVNKTIWLERYIYKGRVWHIPVIDACTLPLLMADPVETFEGVIKHAPVDAGKAWRAALTLFALYEVETLAGLVWRSLRDEVLDLRNRVWWWAVNRWRSFRGDELPF